MTIVVAEAGLRHLAMVCRLESRCFGIERVLTGQWQRIGGPGVCAWIAQIDGEAAGFLIGYPHEIDGAARPYVAVIGVAPQHRRRGAARALLSAALMRWGAAWLHVRASNAGATTLYESLGFELVQRVAAYYRDGEDAYVMARR